MIQLHEPEWDSTDATSLREFLDSATGQRMLGKILFARPSFMASAAHPHKSFASSREIHGYEQAIKMLLSLIEAEDKPLNADTTNPYPDLDDESQWPSETPVS